VCTCISFSSFFHSLSRMTRASFEAVLGELSTESGGVTAFERERHPGEEELDRGWWLPNLPEDVGHRVKDARRRMARPRR
jgi:hypothetical protein